MVTDVNYLESVVLPRRLEGCIVLNEHNTVFARSGLLYVIGLSLGAPSPERKRYLDRFQIFCMAH